MAKLPLAADVAESSTSITVTSAAGGVGAAVVNSSETAYVVLRNAGTYDFEYQIGAGSWTLLPYRGNVTLDVNMAVTTIKTRKTAGSGDGVGQLDTFGFSSAVSAGDESTAVKSTGVPVIEKTASSYTLVATDIGVQIDMNNAGANTLNIPTNATVPFPIGTQVWVCRKGAGATTIAGAGVTLQKPSAKSFTISAQYEKALLHKIATDTWRVNAT
jgi:hypothetical protein